MHVQLSRHPSGAPSQEIFDAFARDGGVIIDDFADAATLDVLEADYRRALDGVPWGNAGLEPNRFFGLRTKRLHGLLEKSQAFAEVISSELPRAMCERFLGPNTREYRISTGELMAIGRAEGCVHGSHSDSMDHSRRA